MDRDAKLELVTKWFYPKSRQDLWFSELKKVVRPDAVVLEIGSGSGQGKQNQSYPDAAEIWGIDVDERVLTNPHLAHAANISAYEIADAFAGQKFDVIYSHMVAEHIDDPERFIQAQLAVLQPDGVLFHSSVSRYYWSSLINNLVPEDAKNWLIANLGGGRSATDIFPAHYRLNTRRDIQRLGSRFHLKSKIIRQDGPPGYLRRSLVLMLVYTAIHKPLQFVFPGLRDTFIFVLRPGATGESAISDTGELTQPAA